MAVPTPNATWESAMLPPMPLPEPHACEPRAVVPVNIAHSPIVPEPVMVPVPPQSEQLMRTVPSASVRIAIGVPVESAPPTTVGVGRWTAAPALPLIETYSTPVEDTRNGGRYDAVEVAPPTTVGVGRCANTGTANRKIINARMSFKLVPFMAIRQFGHACNPVIHRRRVTVAHGERRCASRDVSLRHGRKYFQDAPCDRVSLFVAPLDEKDG